MSVNVLVVDDSAYFRYTISKYLEEDAEISVIGSARDGIDALEQIKLLKPDVIVLDVEMPQMDGLTTLKNIMLQQPTPVIMLSAFTQPGTQTTVRALMRGAVDFVPKPEGNLQTVIQELRHKIKIAAGTRMSTLRSSGLDTVTSSVPPPPKQGAKLFQKGDPLVVIAASTGGPKALQQVLTHLPADLPAAVMLVQHMPPGFTRSLAQRLHNISPLIVQEAADGDRLAKGMALLAPGDFHLCLNGFRQVTLSSGPRRQHVRPAADVTMESAVDYHGSKVIGVVLTGMGYDGTEGAEKIKNAGGKIIAEHESTSVVYGMPASVVNAGLADYVVPLPEIAPTITKLLQNE